MANTLLSALPQITAGIEAVTKADADFAAILENFGPLQFTLKPGGFGGLLRIILGQQVSVLAAEAIWRKLNAAVSPLTPETVAAAAAADETLRGAGLSGQKTRYVRGLAADILEGRLDLDAVKTMDDESAIAAITASIGLGRWTAENYLLFCEARADLFPAKDLGVLAGLEWLKRLDARPTHKQAWDYAERWRPHRSAATLLLWHHYIGETGRRKKTGN